MVLWNRKARCHDPLNPASSIPEKTVPHGAVSPCAADAWDGTWSPWASLPQLLCWPRGNASPGSYLWGTQQPSHFGLFPLKRVWMFIRWSPLWVGSCPQNTFPVVPGPNALFLFHGTHALNSYSCFQAWCICKAKLAHTISSPNGSFLIFLLHSALSLWSWPGPP